MNEFRILGINRHRIHTDGKGITTLVALAGCPLSCRYCINKEPLEDAAHITLVTPDALVERLAIDHCYFLYTDGGVTFGGGEPLLHSRQIAAFANLCPKEWNITLETSLNVPERLLSPLLTGRFSFLVDMKAMQPEIYLNYTGKENSQAVRNLAALSRRLPKHLYAVKLPIIPGYSSQQDVAASARELRELGISSENMVIFRYTIPDTPGIPHSFSSLIKPLI